MNCAKQRRLAGDKLKFWLRSVVFTFACYNFAIAKIVLSLKLECETSLHSSAVLIYILIHTT